MSTAQELPENEQVLMPEEDAGRIYYGCWILCTNAVLKQCSGKLEWWAIPRVIAESKKDLCTSELLKKFDNRDLYFPYSMFLFK
jgi:hypothetical protein